MAQVFYQNILIKEFKGKTAIINGKEIKIWDKSLFDKVDIHVKLKEWIKRWEGKKTMTEAQWYNSHYGKFYFNAYSNEMQEMIKYMVGHPACKYPDFWEWYLFVYCNENIYP